jgi:hypothetical protein
MIRDMTAVVAAANGGIGYNGSMVRHDNCVLSSQNDLPLFLLDLLLIQFLRTAMESSRGHEAL